MQWNPTRNLEDEIIRIMKLDQEDPTMIHQGENRVIPKLSDGVTPGIELPSTHTPFFGESLQVEMTRCGGLVQYRPVVFAKKGEVRDVQLKTRTPDDQTIIPIFCANRSGYSIATEKSTEGNYDAYKLRWIADDIKRTPFQSIGYILRTAYNQNNTITNIRNQTGTIELSLVSSLRILGCNVSRALDGEGGSITVDTYAHPDGVS